MSNRDNIEGRFGDISGKFGDISGKFGDVSGKFGDISGGGIAGIQRVVFEGRLLDEIVYLESKIRRLERDLIGIAGSLDARIDDLEERIRSGPRPSPQNLAPHPDTKPGP